MSLLTLLTLTAMVSDVGPVKQQQPPSDWYLERGTDRRPAAAADDLPEVAESLAALLRDGRVPGFYDGQFAGTRDRFTDLVRIAQDRSFHPTIRTMAVMALQEAADGEVLRDALQPLLMDPDQEYDAEYDEAQWIWQAWAPGPMEENLVRRQLDVDVSRHARFALAKDGQPEAVLERIAVLRQYVDRRRLAILDPSLDGRRDFEAWHGRQVWFDIAYHYQQFDDFESASRWFRQLCDQLPPGADTRMAHYNLACIAALQGHPEQAVAELRLALAAGFLDVDWMDEDGDLTSLRERQDFQEVRRQMLAPEAPPPSTSP